ncbi:tryptophan--tRNA ligase [Candidatus Desulforudis audaxviator]|uniref:Tryptophan--tRNA ligase n=1 Tax=Desulforudis audaxviator (strain MP104C) TaxID=477974 RepID=B1I3Y1_DESAP|nr:tryptophan--tRNA ligase [Candidatus Desulforudis audaxviator]ACA59712.1 tryptophanyl-tRNA synthetase [Candidatus Desulforudis audaxviator MP104C]AZK59705.1 Tryptophanyl-tRNA synthetase [Candidatus Desulforudis audaxviator]
MKELRIVSGMRPSGRLHIGHLSVLSNWLRLQEENDCFFFVADWHALTTAFDDPGSIGENTREMLADWLAVGIDPERSTVFVQSRLLEHAELHLLLSMITPLSWLERVPTYKDQVQQLAARGKDITTYGFLGYPLLQTADILMYRADAVPVGQDQLPHLELSREVARRFNHLYGNVFPEPQALLAKESLLPGVDGRKMSKSYENEISLSASPDIIEKRVRMMITDPARIRKNDPGHPEVCHVYTYQELYNRDLSTEIAASCRAGSVGCVTCKLRLAESLNKYLKPIRERRERLLAQPGLIDEVIERGTEKARAAAGETMRLVRRAMRI